MHDISGKKVLFVPKEEGKGDHILIESALFGQGTSTAYVGLVSYHQVKKMHPKDAIGLPVDISRSVFQHAFDEDFGLSQKQDNDSLGKTIESKSVSLHEEKKSEPATESASEIEELNEEDKGSFVIHPDVPGPNEQFEPVERLKELNIGNFLRPAELQKKGDEKRVDEVDLGDFGPYEGQTEDNKEEETPNLEQQFSVLPGILKLRKIVSIQGEQGVIKPAAGYEIEGNKTKVVDLEGMKNKLNILSKRDQMMFIRAMGGVLLGTKSLHDSGWVHRDEKLLNALILPNGEGKLSDFDISCRSRSPNLNSLQGTPIYLAPEVCDPDNNKGKIDKPCDIWSLGIMLWQMGSGKNDVDHPAVFNNGMPGIIKRGLLTTDSAAKAAYEKNYPEPPKDTLAHLVWEMTRIDPEARPTIDQVRERYNAWAERTTERLQSSEDPIRHMSEAFGGLPSQPTAH